MSGEEGSSPKRKIFQILALLLLLVAFPAISWYYLQVGLDYRVETLGELDDYGNIPTFESVSYKRDTLNRQDLQKRMVLTSFFSLDNESLQAIYGEKLAKLHDQFDDRNDLLFLHYLLDNRVRAEKINAFEMTYSLTDDAQCFFLVDGEPPVEQLAREGYHIPLEEGMELTDNPFLILADTTGTIRRYYDIRDDEEVKLLVEHIAMLLPRQKERDLVFKREQEK